MGPGELIEIEDDVVSGKRLDIYTTDRTGAARTIVAGKNGLMNELDHVLHYCPVHDVLRIRLHVRAHR